jgi:hypothetical protein
VLDDGESMACSITEPENEKDSRKEETSDSDEEQPIV